jgi:hypothetical protein
MLHFKQLIKRLYRKFIPRSLRDIISTYRDNRKDYFFNLKKDIIKFLKRDIKNNPNQEKLEILEFLKAEPFYMVPYNFKKNYNQNDIVVHFDLKCKMGFVFYNKKKLYFPSEWNTMKIKEYYNSILIEQDIKSPHRYEFYDFCVQENDIVADIGAAEGFFVLSIIEKSKKVYLFECDEKWTAALKMTFEPWKEKISIINKFVSDTNEANNIKMDDFFIDKNINFIKVDIEGEESKFLRGASKILTTQKPLRIALCVYHKEKDADEFKKILIENEFNVDFSYGYLLPWMQLTPPYLRKGIIRATKT